MCLTKGPLLIVPWRCTYACSSNCAHCVSAGKTAAPDEVDTKTALKIVDQIHDSAQAILESQAESHYCEKTSLTYSTTPLLKALAQASSPTGACSMRTLSSV